MKKSARHKKSYGPFATLGIGILISAVIYVLFVLISSLILGGLDNPLGGLGIASLLSFFPPALISGFLISKLKGDGGVVAAGITSFIIALMLFLCSATVTQGSFPISSTLSYVAYVILAVMGGMLGRKSSRRRFKA